MEDCNPNYKIGDHVLRWSDETRDIGVIIDEKLNFNSHTSVPMYGSCCNIVHQCSRFIQ